jgi:hypothetical protein
MRDYASDYDHYSGQPVAMGGYNMAAAAAAAMQMRMAALAQLGGMMVYGWPGGAAGGEGGDGEWYEEGGEEEQAGEGGEAQQE